MAKNYNLLMQNGLTASRKLIRPLAVPTKILLDSRGVVQWLETSEDYRVRKQPEQVLELVRETLP